MSSAEAPIPHQGPSLAPGLAHGTAGHGHPGHGPAKTAPLVLAALGIVFGDIGTSPIYTMKECMHEGHGVHATTGNILGVLSLIVWSLTLVVTVKYLLFVMRANNQGEGGILALLALVPDRFRSRGKEGIGVVALLVIAGAALLYGDGMITPAISVLSAIEGIGEEAPKLHDYIVPITCVVLFGLFAIQSRGTGGVGKLFGPVMVVWFLTLGGLGAWHLLKAPHILVALDPRHAVYFFEHHKVHGLIVLGSVVLAVTGGEALYADMGHFGTRPIRIAWICLVFPSLLLAYFGQGALILEDPARAASPFFAMVPAGPPKIALVAIATFATIIASQALISGAFSLTHQAVQLGFFPRVTVKHTSRETEGQIYVPEINWLLAGCCIALVIGFEESGRLAAAYGIAVTGTMAITSIVYFVVLRTTWQWPLWKALPILLFFLAFDLPFFGANVTKIKDGGYVPILVGAIFFACMVVWNRGRRFLGEFLSNRTRPYDDFFAEIDKNEVRRAPGCSVILARTKDGVPQTLAHHFDRTHALAEHVVLLTVKVEHVPVVTGKRVYVVNLGRGFFRVDGHYGFMEQPDVPALLREAKSHGLDVELDENLTYFLGRETLLAQPGGRMGEWEEGLFAFLSRNSRPATAYFRLPPEQVVEIGTQIDL